MPAQKDDSQTKIKSALLSHRASILSQLVETDYNNPFNQLLPETVDEGQALFLQQIEHGLKQHFQQELRTIQTTLARIETGNYGQCICCGLNINGDKLDTNPMTNHCVTCRQDSIQSMNISLRIDTQTIAANDR